MKMYLTLWHKFQLAIQGYAFLYHEKTERGHLDKYVVKCKKHGLFCDYPHGYKERFDCPQCLDETKNMGGE